MSLSQFVTICHFFGSCKEPSKSLCCMCVCVFKPELWLSLAMNESWMGNNVSVVSCQSSDDYEWCWWMMLMNDALIKQEPHDWSVLLFENVLKLLLTNVKQILVWFIFVHFRFSLMYILFLLFFQLSSWLAEDWSLYYSQWFRWIKSC